MRAAVLTEVNKPLQILDLEQEGPKTGEVRVQVKAAGEQWKLTLVSPRTASGSPCPSSTTLR